MASLAAIAVSALVTLVVLWFGALARERGAMVSLRRLSRRERPDQPGS